MSDDPTRPEPEHELEIDLSAFLPEGSRFATDDDDESDEDGSVEDEEHEVASDLAETEVDGPTDETARSAVSATSSGSTDPDDGWGTDAPAPEIPAWARDDLPPPPAPDPETAATAPMDPDPSTADADADAATEADGEVDDLVALEPDAGPAVAAVPEVDTTVLTRIEGELADVDAAIAAIDAGDLTRSPLLAELLSTESAGGADSTTVAPDTTPHP